MILHCELFYLDLKQIRQNENMEKKLLELSKLSDWLIVTKSLNISKTKYSLSLKTKINKPTKNNKRNGYY